MKTLQTVAYFIKDCIFMDMHESVTNVCDFYAYLDYVSEFDILPPENYTALGRVLFQIKRIRK